MIFLYLWEIGISESVVKSNGLVSLVGGIFLISEIFQVLSGNREDVLVIYKWSEGGDRAVLYKLLLEVVFLLSLKE